MKTSDPRAALWTATATPAPECPPLEGDRRTGVVVIGGGFTGLSAALHLAEAGVETILLEAQAPGFGASGRNNGQVVPAYSRHNPDEIAAQFGAERGEAMNAWVQESASLVFDLIRRHGIDCDAQQNGWLMPAHNEARLAVARQKHDQWAARGAPVDFLDAAATAEMTGSQHYAGAWLHRAGGNIQPLSYARGLARAAQAAGAVLHASSPALAVERAGQDWQVKTPGGTVTADTVVLATNAYTGDLWPDLARSIVPMRLFQAATEPLGDNVARTILPGRQSISDARRVLWAFRKDAEGRIVTGASPLFTMRPSRALARMSCEQLISVFPQINEVRFQHLWDGRIAVTLDRLPRLFDLAEGVYAGLGYSGRGIAMATGMGKLLAERVQGRAAEECPVLPGPAKPLPLRNLLIPLARARAAWWRLRDAAG